MTSFVSISCFFVVLLAGLLWARLDLKPDTIPDASAFDDNIQVKETLHALLNVNDVTLSRYNYSDSEPRQQLKARGWLFGALALLSGEDRARRALFPRKSTASLSSALSLGDLPTLLTSVAPSSRPFYQRLALVLMVRNESPFIAATLKSVAGVVDLVVVMDTGSTDDTIDVIRQVVARDLNNVPLHLLEHEFEDFARSRNRLLNFAEDKARWLLLLDANDMLDPASHEPLRALVSQPELSERYCAVSVTQRWQRPFSEHVALRLIKTGCNWHYEQPVHEFLTTLDGETDLTLNHGAPDQQGLENDCPTFEGARSRLVLTQDRGNGGAESTNSRLKRDVDLLREYSQQHPRDPRSVYYLARTLAHTNSPEEALAYYLKRIEMGGQIDEQLFAINDAVALTSVEDLRMNLWSRIWPIALGLDGFLEMNSLRLQNITKALIKFINLEKTGAVEGADVEEFGRARYLARSCLVDAARACFTRYDEDALRPSPPVYFSHTRWAHVALCAEASIAVEKRTRKHAADDRNGDDSGANFKINWSLAIQATEQWLSSLKQLGTAAQSATQGQFASGAAAGERGAGTASQSTETMTANDAENVLKTIRKWVSEESAPTESPVEKLLGFSCRGKQVQAEPVRVHLYSVARDSYVEVDDEMNLRLVDQPSEFSVFLVNCATDIDPLPSISDELRLINARSRDPSLYNADWTRVGEGWFTLQGEQDGFLTADFGGDRRVAADRAEATAYERWQLLPEMVLDSNQITHDSNSSSSNSKDDGIFLRLQSWHATYLTVPEDTAERILSARPVKNFLALEQFKMIKL